MMVPDVLDELSSRHHSMTLSDQVHDQVQHPRLDVDYEPMTSQHELVAVYFDALKTVNHRHHLFRPAERAPQRNRLSEHLSDLSSNDHRLFWDCTLRLVELATFYQCDSETLSVVINVAGLSREDGLAVVEGYGGITRDHFAMSKGALVERPESLSSRCSTLLFRRRLFDQWTVRRSSVDTASTDARSSDRELAVRVVLIIAPSRRAGTHLHGNRPERANIANCFRGTMGARLRARFLIRRGSMRISVPATVLAATLWMSAGCGANALPARDAGGTGGFGTGGFYGQTGGRGTGGGETGGFFGTGGIAGVIDASVDAVGGLACPGLPELTGSPAPVPPYPGCPCTRRPGAGNSYLCPMGVGQKSYLYLDASGGEVILLGQQSAKTNIPFGLNIPPGAVDKLTLISIEETALPPPSGFLDWSPVYLVEPRGLLFAKVAGVQIPWSSNLTQVPGKLAIYARDENGSCGWKPLIDSYTNAGYEQASLTELGYLFVGVPSTIDPSTCTGDASAGN